MAELKTKATDVKVSAFIKNIPEEELRRDCDSLVALFSKITGEEGKMWGSSIVGFGHLHYVSESGREGDWFQCGFSPRKAAISIYGLGSAQRFPAHLKKLGKHSFGKGCLYVKKLADINLSVLEELSKLSLAVLMKRYSEEGNAEAKKKGVEKRKLKKKASAPKAKVKSATKKKTAVKKVAKKKKALPKKKAAKKK